MLRSLLAILSLSVLPAYGTELAIKAQFEAAGHFNEGVAPVLSDGKWGLIDRNGNWVLEPKFERLRKGVEGMFAAFDGSNWGYVDSSGTVRIAPRFKHVRNFSNGYAAVSEGRRWRFINREGQFVSNQTFAIVSNVENFRFAAVASPGAPLVIYSIDLFGKDGSHDADEPLTIGYNVNYQSEQFDMRDGAVYLLSPDLTRTIYLQIQDELFFIRYRGETAISLGNQVIGYPGSHKFSKGADNQIYCKNSQGQSFIYNISMLQNNSKNWVFRGSQRYKNTINDLTRCGGELADTEPLKTVRMYDRDVYVVVMGEGEGYSNFLRQDLTADWEGMRTYNLSRIYAFSENYALYKSKDKKFGFIKRDNRTLSDKTGAIFEDGYSYREGFAPVKVGGKWGFVSFEEETKIVKRVPVTIQPE